MSAAVLTSDTSRWLFLALFGVALSAYLGCGALAAIARAHLARSPRRGRRSVVPARVVLSLPKEITS